MRAGLGSLQDMVGADRCIWSGETTSNLVTVDVPVLNRWGRPAGVARFHVQPAHREEFVEFSHSLARRGPWFVPAIGLFLAVVIVAGLLDSRIGAGIGVALLGVTVVALPFPTPETVNMLGWRKATLLARALGIALGIAGIVLATTSQR